MSLSSHYNYIHDIKGSGSVMSNTWVTYSYSACLERSIFTLVLVSDVASISVTFDTSSAVVTAGSPLVASTKYLDNSLISIEESYNDVVSKTMTSTSSYT